MPDDFILRDYYGNIEWFPTCLAFMLFLLVGIILAFIIYAAWDWLDRTSGDPMTESGIVKAISYAPEQSGTGTTVAPVMGAGGGMAIGVTSVIIPEKYTVVFKCEKHGRVFSVDSKKLFGVLTVGQKVKIRYKEIRRRWIEKGKFVDFDFLSVDGVD